MSATKKSFYRRKLPDLCTPFSSEAGRGFFTEALADGLMTAYFPLAEQFRTQDEPAYCGLSTLTMVLNALTIDPGKVWKGPWRWYHEDMLDCCVPLDHIKQHGLVLEQFKCLAICNNCAVECWRPSESTLSEFRARIAASCSHFDSVIVASYSRKSLGQTGSGHYSPIAGYHRGSDKVLILDVARFKYPPYWVSLVSLYESMEQIDTTTQKARGYFALKRTEHARLSLFHLRTTTPDTIASLRTKVTSFLREFQDTPACERTHVQVQSLQEELCSIQDMIESFVEYCASAVEGTDKSCYGTSRLECSCLSSEHYDTIKVLLQQLEASSSWQLCSGAAQVLCPRSTCDSGAVPLLAEIHDDGCTCSIDLPRMYALVAVCMAITDTIPQDAPLRGEILTLCHMLRELGP